MLQDMKECVRALTEHDLDQLEIRIGVRLPHDYREFLLKYNGGRPIPSGFLIQGFPNNPYGMIHYFFGIDDQLESNNLMWHWEVMNGRLPDGLLPIAGDHSGDLLCLTLYGDKHGSVVFWDFYDEHYPPTYKNIYHVANSFSDFIDSLFKAPEEGD